MSVFLFFFVGEFKKIRENKKKKMTSVVHVNVYGAAELVQTNGNSEMEGDLDMGSNKIINLLTPTESTDAANKSYVDTEITNIDYSEFIQRDGSVAMTADLDMGGQNLANVANISCAAVSAFSLSGTLNTASQPTVTSLGQLNLLDVDNVRINDNTISSTNTDGDIILNPAGSGKVNVAGNSLDLDELYIDNTFKCVNINNSNPGADPDVKFFCQNHGNSMRNALFASGDDFSGMNNNFFLGSKNSTVMIIGAGGDVNELSQIKILQLQPQITLIGPTFEFTSSRATPAQAVAGTYVSVADGDGLGRIRFMGDDGNDQRTSGCELLATVDGTVTSNIVPTKFQIRMGSKDSTLWRPNGEMILPKFSSDPTGEAGSIYYNTTSNVVRFHNGTSWNNI